MFDSADDQLNIRPLSKEEAKLLRQKNPPLSPWRVISLQVLVVLVVAFVTRLVTQNAAKTYSLVWGGLCVIVPSSVFAYALSRQIRSRQSSPSALLVGMFVWELVKVVLTVAMLLMTSRVVSGVSWLMLVLGFVLTMKVYWAVCCWVMKTPRLMKLKIMGM